MQLIELFLPVYDNNNKKIPADLFKQTYDELIDEFGGLTAYTRAPMQGFWQKENDKVVKDELIIYEVMDDHFSSKWWHNYRTCLETRFKQERLIIRTHAIKLL
ncbi:Uncharacterised protein [Legionella beliardensis]|uniref:DUF1330 domain-containing protein n=1 Tax=Legionella beliardensis TaxID=91822 RepID=A0A378I0Y3_9GAMM|nr:hypothetical protein [Legionella beliardensis]STX28848.1 Uncharacterised protein [Legionella beliardensis]